MFSQMSDLVHGPLVCYLDVFFSCLLKKQNHFVSKNVGVKQKGLVSLMCFEQFNRDDKHMLEFPHPLLDNVTFLMQKKKKKENP